jgi:hypothetical protein
VGLFSLLYGISTGQRNLSADWLAYSAFLFKQEGFPTFSLVSGALLEGNGKAKGKGREGKWEKYGF